MLATETTTSPPGHSEEEIRIPTLGNSAFPLSSLITFVPESHSGRMQLGEFLTLCGAPDSVCDEATSLGCFIAPASLDGHIQGRVTLRQWADSLSLASGAHAGFFHAARYSLGDIASAISLLMDGSMRLMGLIEAGEVPLRPEDVPVVGDRLTFSGMNVLAVRALVVELHDSGKCPAWQSGERMGDCVRMRFHGDVTSEHLLAIRASLPPNANVWHSGAVMLAPALFAWPKELTTGRTVWERAFTAPWFETSAVRVVLDTQQIVDGIAGHSELKTLKFESDGEQVSLPARQVTVPELLSDGEVSLTGFKDSAGGEVRKCQIPKTLMFILKHYDDVMQSNWCEEKDIVLHEAGGYSPSVGRLIARVTHYRVYDKEQRYLLTANPAHPARMTDALDKMLILGGDGVPGSVADAILDCWMRLCAVSKGSQAPANNAMTFATTDASTDFSLAQLQGIYRTASLDSTEGWPDIIPHLARYNLHAVRAQLEVRGKMMRDREVSTLRFPFSAEGLSVHFEAGRPAIVRVPIQGTSTLAYVLTLIPRRDGRPQQLESTMRRAPPTAALALSTAIATIKSLSGVFSPEKVRELIDDAKQRIQEEYDPRSAESLRLAIKDVDSGSSSVSTGRGGGRGGRGRGRGGRGGSREDNRPAQRDGAASGSGSGGRRETRGRGRGGRGALSSRE